MFPAHLIEDPLEFCNGLQPFARSVGPIVINEEEDKENYISRGKNKMTCFCYRKPSINLEENKQIKKIPSVFHFERLANTRYFFRDIHHKIFYEDGY